MELTIAVAIIATVFAAVMPLFAGIRNSADARWANLEMVQNARILNEQLSRSLAGALRITTASASTSDDGFIEFEAADGTTYRCALAADGCVEFGPVGDLSELVGPVDYLRFVCYDGNDLDNPAPTSNGARLVAWEAGLQSVGRLAQDKIVRGACYLRTAARGEEISAGYDFATTQPDADSFAFADQSETQTPDQPDVPALPLDALGYGALRADDGQLHSILASGDSQFAQARLTFRINQDEQDVTTIAASWNGRGVNTHPTAADGAALYIWDYDSSRYELLQTSPNTETEITLSGSAAGSAVNYLGGEGGKTAVLLVVSNDRKTGSETNTLFTDYVKLDVIASPGGGIIEP